MNDEYTSDSSISSESDWDLSSEDEPALFLDDVNIRNENYFENTIQRYTDEEYFQHFRVSKHIAQSLSEQFENSEYFTYHSGGNGKLAASKLVHIYLWYVGHETASFRDVSDRFDITINTLFTIIRRLTNFISNLANDIIKWPNENEKIEIETHFRDNNFAEVIGVIDGTHIRIDKPAADPNSYLNRKQFYSILMQVVCDHRHKIRDVFVGYPGSVHDSRVYRTSPLANELRDKCQHYCLLGDSGYPWLPNLITPYKDRGELTPRQRNYNLKHAKNRYVIEHCFGILKLKFRQLFHIKLHHIPTIVHLIRACCVLHNLALEDNLPEVLENEVVDGIHNVLPAAAANEEDMEDDRHGLEVRNNIANNLPM